MYHITRAFEPIQCHYRTSLHTHRYIPPRPQGYTQGFQPRYERTPTVRTIKASYFVDNVEKQAQRQLARKKAKDSYLSLTAATDVFTKKKYRENKNDWVRFFEPIVIYSSQYKKEETKKPKKVGYQLIALKNPGIHQEFLIRERTTNRLVKWDDLPIENIVREYLRIYGFPEDKYYSGEDFMHEVENGSREIFLCVEKRRTADFILNMCYELIGRTI